MSFSPPPASFQKEGRTYRIVKEIARSDAASVFRVEHDGQEFLLKPYSEEETRLLSRIYHPALRSWVTTITLNSQTWNLLEWRGGQSLAESSLPLASQHFDQFARSILGAVALLHDHGVLHGDISPGNILADFSPKHPQFTLIDLGMASRPHKREQHQKIQGTLGWIAPERGENSAVTAQADLFSLGRVIQHIFDPKELSLHQQHWTQSLCQENPQDRFPHGRKALEALLAHEASPRIYPQQIHLALTQGDRLANPQAIWIFLHPHLLVDKGTTQALFGKAQQNLTAFLESLRPFSLDAPTVEEFAKRVVATTKPKKRSTPTARKFTVIESLIQSGKIKTAEKQLKGIKCSSAEEEVVTHRLLSLITFHQGHLTKALKQTKRARVLASQTGLSAEYAALLNLSGALYQKQGNLSRASSSFRRSALVAGSIGDRLPTAKALFNLAHVEQYRNRFRAAEKRYVQCEELFRAQGSYRELAHVLIQHARLKIALAQFSTAQHLLGQAERFLPPDAHKERAQLHILQADLLFGAGEIASFQKHVDHLLSFPWAEQYYPFASLILEGQRLMLQNQPAQALELIKRRCPKLAETSLVPIDRSLTLLKIHAEISLNRFEAKKFRSRFSPWFSQPPSGELVVSFLMDRFRLLLLLAGSGQKVETELEDTRITLLGSVTKLEAAYLEKKIAQARKTLGPPSATDAEESARSGSRFPLPRILDVALRCTSEEDPRAVLYSLLTNMIQISSATRGFVLVKKGRKIQRELAVPEEEGDLLEVSVTIAEKTLETGKAFYTKDALHEKRLAQYHSVQDLKLRGIVTFPLHVRGEVVAAIYLENREHPFVLAPEDMGILQRLADQAALAWQTLKLLEHNKKYQERIEKLNTSLQETLLVQNQKIARLESQTSQEKRSDLPLVLRGRSQKNQAVMELIRRGANHDISILIHGEHGTGKMEVARYLHRVSGRHSESLVSLDCASMAETLIEAELCGHLQGAFTGASRDYLGLVRSAGRGTLVLNLVDGLSPSAQSLLLQIVASREIRPVGSNESYPVECRFVATMNGSPHGSMEEGKLRPDLFYALGQFDIPLLPLRDRKEDFAEILRLVLNEVKDSVGRPSVRITARALELLEVFPWPGNLWQLRAELERALVLADEVIDLAQLSPEIQDFRYKRRSTVSGVRQESALRSNMSEVERDILVQVLRECKGNQRMAAKELGIPRSTLYRRLKKFGLAGKKRAKGEPV